MMEGFNLQEWEKEAEKNSFTPLPIGTYKGIIFDLQATESKNGKAMIKVTFKLTDGDYKNRQIFSNYIMNAASWWKFRELLIAAQYDTAQLPKQVKDHYELLSYIKNDMLGKSVWLKVGQREYEGNIYNDVKKVTPAENDDENEIGDLPSLGSLT